jgi:hypothetical protein
MNHPMCEVLPKACSKSSSHSDLEVRHPSNNPTLEGPSTNEPDEIHIISERSKNLIAITAEVIFGKPHLVLRKGHFIRGGPRFWSNLYFLIKLSEVPELHRVLSQYLDQENLENGDWGPSQEDEPLPPIKKGIGRLSLQDQVLFYLDQRFDPEQVRHHVLGEALDTRLRFTEIGKALRRSGYLRRRSWALTDEGRERVRTIKGEHPGGEGNEGDEGEAGSTTGQSSHPVPQPSGHATLNLC